MWTFTGSLNQNWIHYLQTFWFNARTKKGSHYTSSSLETIRFGLNRCLKKFGHNYDITKKECISFTKSIQAYEDAQKELKEIGKGVIESAKEITNKGNFSIIKIHNHKVYISI